MDILTDRNSAIQLLGPVVDLGGAIGGVVDVWGSFNGFGLPRWYGTSVGLGGDVDISGGYGTSTAVHGDFSR